MKGAVVGGPSKVFMWYHGVCVTKIRGHLIENRWLCKNLCYDPYALYLSIMLKEMLFWE